MKELIKTCPNCKVTLGIDKSLVNQSIECPNCNHKFTISSQKLFRKKVTLFLLGIIFIFGIIISYLLCRNYYYHPQKVQERINARYEWGILLFEKRNMKKAGITAIQEAAEQGHVKAQYFLGDYYSDGYGDMPKDISSAALWYRKAAEQGYIAALCPLADCYMEMGNMKEAVNWYRKAAEQGHVKAQYRLGECYYLGKGVEKSLDKAIKLLRNAEKQGNFEAQKILKSEEIRLYIDAIEKNTPQAQFDLGIYYYGISGQLEQSGKWMKKAAEQGHVEAQYFLGVYYRDGYGGMPKNISSAALWYRKAAEQGYIDALCPLADCYMEMDNMKEAVNWYRKAAEQGDKNAKMMLEEHELIRRYIVDNENNDSEMHSKQLTNTI